MNELPSDPVMLLSVVNTKLRDEYDSLEELCRSYGVQASVIIEKLAAIDYSYEADTNQFI